jgi:hypothetical protein
MFMTKDQREIQRKLRILCYAEDADLNNKQAEWEKFYNLARVHGAHNGKTHYEALGEKL